MTKLDRKTCSLHKKMLNYKL